VKPLLYLVLQAKLLASFFRRFWKTIQSSRTRCRTLTFASLPLWRRHSMTALDWKECSKSVLLI